MMNLMKDMHTFCLIDNLHFKIFFEKLGIIFGTRAAITKLCSDVACYTRQKVLIVHLLDYTFEMGRLSHWKGREKLKNQK